MSRFLKGVDDDLSLHHLIVIKISPFFCATQILRFRSSAVTMSNCPPPRPPYLSPLERDSFSIKLTASCHCGRVKYHLCEDEPLDSKFCHCRGCQVIHGKISPQARSCEAYLHQET